MKASRVKCRKCDKQARYITKRLCKTHYQKLWISGTLRYKHYPKECRICGKEVLAKRLCRNHYMKKKRSGTFAPINKSYPAEWTSSERHRFSRYALRPEDFEALRIEQGNVCAICAIPFLGNEMHVDHCHKTRLSRGLLCFRCNMALGAMEARGISPERYTDYVQLWRIRHAKP